MSLQSCAFLWLICIILFCMKSYLTALKLNWNVGCWQPQCNASYLNRTSLNNLAHLFVAVSTSICIGLLFLSFAVMCQHNYFKQILTCADCHFINAFNNIFRAQLLMYTSKQTGQCLHVIYYSCLQIVTFWKLFSFVLIVKKIAKSAERRIYEEFMHMDTGKHSFFVCIQFFMSVSQCFSMIDEDFLQGIYLTFKQPFGSAAWRQNEQYI